MFRIGQKCPNPSVLTTIGLFELHKYFGQNWSIILSHPADFTPVCTTELSSLARLQSEFEKRETKVICLSVDSLEDHNLWKQDIEHYAECKVNYPLIADADGSVSEELGMLDPSQRDKGALQAVRAVYFISPDKKIRAVIAYPMSTGRNFDEIIRVLDSLQLHWKRGDIVTPSDWLPGQKVLVKPNEIVPDDAISPDLPSKKAYINFINC